MVLQDVTNANVTTPRRGFVEIPFAKRKMQKQCAQVHLRSMAVYWLRPTWPTS